MFPLCASNWGPGPQYRKVAGVKVLWGSTEFPYAPQLLCPFANILHTRILLAWSQLRYIITFAQLRYQHYIKSTFYLDFTSFPTNAHFLVQDPSQGNIDPGTAHWLGHSLAMCSQKSACNFWRSPKLTNNINCWLTHILYVLCVVYYILTIE